MRLFKMKGMKENPWCVTLFHYINNRLPNVDGLIPLIVVKNPICVIENTCRNTYICFHFEKLGAKKIVLRPKFTKLSPCVELTKSSSKPKYDSNTTQNICTRRSKKLDKMREKNVQVHTKVDSMVEG